MSTGSQISPNAARTSDRIADLFPQGVAAAELRGVGDPAWLHPSEVPAVARSVPKRVQEFAAGRRCARLALASFGILDASLPVAADRRAVWPAGFTGSISHTEGLCIAVVAASERLASIGVDCEVISQVTREVWPTVFTDREAGWVAAQNEAVRPTIAALLFAVKEAFYKCQYPLTLEWLDFRDLDVEIHFKNDWEGRFAVHPTRSLAVAAHVDLPAGGRYLIDDGIVVAGVAFDRR